MWWKLRLELRHWQREFGAWVMQWMPVRCARCGDWLLWRNGRSAKTTLGQWVRVCNPCYVDLYGEGQDENEEQNHDES